MRECRTSGSVRGALSNERPYRDYEPHKSWWMLTGESWAVKAVLHCCICGYQPPSSIWVLVSEVRRLPREKTVDQGCYVTCKLLGHSQRATSEQPVMSRVVV